MSAVRYCGRGHALTPENIFFSLGRPRCRECNKLRHKRYYYEHRALGHSRLACERGEEIAAMRRAGMSIRQIAEKIGRGQTAVFEALRAMKVPPVPYRWPESPSRRRVIELTARGLTHQQIADELGFCLSTARWHAERAGIPPRKSKAFKLWQARILNETRTALVAAHSSSPPDKLAAD